MSASVVAIDVCKRHVSQAAGQARLGSGRLARAAGHPLPEPAWTVDHISFTIQPAEIFGLVGPENAGKSALVRMLAAQILPDAGSLRVFGLDIARQAAQIQRLVNRVSGEASFYRNLSALENLARSAQQYGFSRSEALRSAREVLARLGVEEETQEQPLASLPRNLQSVVSIARALVSRPKLLLLDEPARDLDPVYRKQVFEAIVDLREQRSMTVVIATRDWVEAALFCDRIALLENGRLVDTLTLGQPELITPDYSSQAPTPGARCLELPTALR